MNTFSYRGIETKSLLADRGPRRTRRPGRAGTCRQGVSPHTIQRPARRTRWRAPVPGRYRPWGIGGQVAMKRAFVFPGQGSQAVGMGRDLADAFPEARRLFDEVDNSLSQQLSRLMFEGPESELTLTENAQPALMAASLAVMRVLETEGGLDLSQ